MILRALIDDSPFWLRAHQARKGAPAPLRLLMRDGIRQAVGVSENMGRRCRRWVAERLTIGEAMPVVVEDGEAPIHDPDCAIFPDDDFMYLRRCDCGAER